MQMRKRRQKYLAALLGLLLLLSACLQGCSEDTSAPVLTLGNVSISENVFHYWASTYKGDFLYRYAVPHRHWAGISNAFGGGRPRPTWETT